MARFFLVAAAMVMLTASWVSAGNFDVLADAGIGTPPTPLHIKAGDVVKAEFKSNLSRNSEMELESDTLLPEPAAARETSQVKARPAVAFRQRSARGMAPPPRVAPKSQQLGARAEAADETPDLESDLEKDLVISPPPPKTEQKPGMEEMPAADRKSGVEQKAVTEKKADKKKAGPAVKRVAPKEFGSYAGSPKPIQKVHPPVAQNPWSYPAGAYENRPYPGRQYLTDEPRRAVNHSNKRVNGYPAAMNPGYTNIDPRRAAIPPAAADRFVRDGVTIRLAPAAAPAIALDPREEDESSGSDILSSAAEIIGLPFAFISSLF
ncbi:MAG: hypothetical protein ACLP5H_32465 [Desulfomonilaceae bacterium]